MRCPKCGYITFDHIEICKNCGKGLQKTPASPTPHVKEKSCSAKNTDFQIIKDNRPAADVSCEGLVDRSETSGSDKKEGSVDRPKGGFWRRSLAFILDLFVIRILFKILSWAIKMGFATGSGILDTSPGSFSDIRKGLLAVVGFLFFATYFIYFHSTTGQTPGKWILNLKVISSEGRILSLFESIERFFGYFVSALPLYVGFLIVAFNHNKRGLHDLIANTYVIKTG